MKDAGQGYNGATTHKLQAFQKFKSEINQFNKK